jgi:hypothetical protein
MGRERKREPSVRLIAVVPVELAPYAHSAAATANFTRPSSDGSDHEKAIAASYLAQTKRKKKRATKPAKKKK